MASDSMSPRTFGGVLQDDHLLASTSSYSLCLSEAVRGKICYNFFNGNNIDGRYNFTMTSITARVFFFKVKEECGDSFPSRMLVFGSQQAALKFCFLPTQCVGVSKLSKAS